MANSTSIPDSSPILKRFRGLMLMMAIIPNINLQIQSLKPQAARQSYSRSEPQRQASRQNSVSTPANSIHIPKHDTSLNYLLKRRA